MITKECLISTNGYFTPDNAAYLISNGQNVESLFSMKITIKKKKIDNIKKILQQEEYILFDGGDKYRNKDKNIIVDIFDYGACFRVGIHSYTEEKCNTILTLLKPFEYKIKLNKQGPKINLLVGHADGGFALKQVTLNKKINIDLENNYNTNFPINKIIPNLIGKTSKYGLYLFTGHPGTGKTTLIKYLSQKYLNAHFVFISNENFNILTNPNFVNFCILQLKNSILILEDSESLLASRSTSNNPFISSVLNLTDGIYGDILNLKIIATLNTEDKIDSALLRKGRLIAKVDFKPLTLEQSTNVIAKLNKQIEPKEGMILTDIYNTEDNGVTNNKQKLGF